MANLEELVIQLSADTKSLQAEMKSAVQIMGKSTDEMKKSVENFSKDGSKGASVFQNAVGTMAGFIGSQLVLGAVNLLKDTIVDLFREGIDGASEGQQAFNDFSQGLATAGKYSEAAAKEFKAFADEQQNLTGISAEAYLSTGKLLTALNGLYGPILKDASSAIADLSVRMGVDMDSATKQFAKSVENGESAFRGMALEFEKGATKAETTANLIAALGAKMGGAAASQAGTYSGSLNILKKSFGEVTEEMGNLLVQNPILIKTVNEISKLFIELSNYLSENKTEFIGLVGEGIIFATEGIATLVGVVNDLMKVFSVLGQVIAQPFQQLAIGIEAAKALASGDFTEAKNILINGASEIANEWKHSLDDSPTLMNVQDKLYQVSGAARAAFQSFQEDGKIAEVALDGVKNKTNESKEALTSYQEATKAWAISLSESADSALEIYSLDLETLKAQLDAKLLTEEEYLVAKNELQLAQYAEEKRMLDESLASGLISREQYANANLAVTNKNNISQMQQMAAMTKFEQDQQKLRQENLKSSLSTIASLSNSGNKALASIGKAAAISQATMDGYVAINKALASAPPPFNYGLAAAVGVATARNISGIISTPLATGIDSVPGIGANDNFPAILAPQERVVPRETNRDLTEFLANQGGQARASINVNVNISDVFTSDPREVGLKIIETINEAAQANGITFLGSNIT